MQMPARTPPANRKATRAAPTPAKNRSSDLNPFAAAARALADERDVGRGAARFHATLAAALADWAETAARRHGLATVAAGGGCLFNRLLAADLQQRLRRAGLRLLLAQRLPPGDSAIALGQAVVARQHLGGS